MAFFLARITNYSGYDAFGLVRSGFYRGHGPASEPAAHPERFVGKPFQPPILPHVFWINPPKEPSAWQNGAGATISTADD